LWDDLSQQIYGFLNEINLQDLMDENSIKGVAARQDAMMNETDNPKVTLTE
jgi:hypothetical protein